MWSLQNKNLEKKIYIKLSTAILLSNRNSGWTKHSKHFTVLQDETQQHNWQCRFFLSRSNKCHYQLHVFKKKLQFMARWEAKWVFPHIQNYSKYLKDKELYDWFVRDKTYGNNALTFR